MALTLVLRPSGLTGGRELSLPDSPATGASGARAEAAA